MSTDRTTTNAMAADPRRVCLTGIGTLTPFATGWSETFAQIDRAPPVYEPWDAALGRPFDTARLGLLRDIPKARHFDERQSRLMDRAMAMAGVAAALAMEDAGILAGGEVVDTDADEVATVLASSQGEIPSLFRFGMPLFKPGSGSFNPAHFPMIARNIACGHLALRFGLRGWSTMIAAGDASGAQALARAAELITLGRAEVVVVGAYETLSSLSLHQLKGRWRKHGLQETVARCAGNHHVPVEGACFLVLESAEHAAARGRVPYACLSHVTQGYRLSEATPWEPVLDRHSRRASWPAGSPAIPVLLRAAQPGPLAQPEQALSEAAAARHQCRHVIDVRADFGAAGAVTALYQAALAAQLLRTTAAPGEAVGAPGTPPRRHPTATQALISTWASSGAYALLSMEAA